MTMPEVLSFEEETIETKKKSKKPKSWIPIVGSFLIKEEEYNNVTVYALRVDENGWVKDKKVFKLLQKPYADNEESKEYSLYLEEVKQCIELCNKCDKLIVSANCITAQKFKFRL